MKLSAEQAKERILMGDIAGDHEVTGYLDMSSCIIPKWPHWKFSDVNLQKAKIDEIGGSFTFLDCSESTLQRIDPNLSVIATSDGVSASFLDCKQLKKTGGNFMGATIWQKSGITEIDKSTKFGRDNKEGICADFIGCEDLKKVQGVFVGFTNWCGSGIQEIDPNTQFGVSTGGQSAFFENCEQLKIARGVFPGFTSWHGSGITKIDAKTQFGIANDGRSISFTRCTKLNPITYAKKPKGSVHGNVTFRMKPPALSSMEF